MPQQLDNIKHISDDVSIAQGLLARPNLPLRRGTSFTSTTTGGQVEVFNEGDASPEARNGGQRRIIQSSNTWTASSGEALSELDDVEDRTFFVNEYNRLALKHGVRTLVRQKSDFINMKSGSGSNKSGSWFSRKILRRTSSTQSVKTKSERITKHRRSISDLSLRLKSKSDTLKDKDLQDLVRLCGLSLLYLPTEYAASSLAVPTCFRATAQYLVQHASTTRGVFRIPGSHNVVASLYNHYCTMDTHGEVIAGTVRCPTLPEHIRCDVHDVASAFKKFISGLPGGILGSLPLFDALISIQSQLNSVPELTRTKQSKVRARLIALALATLRSQYRRELICAVFGLLSMIGRAAETAPRENDRGRPLPTSDLMGYGPLGIVFGPLLLGDMLENYTMHLANHRGGLVLLPVSPPKSRKERSKKSRASEDSSDFDRHVDKIKIANSITEMLITHWRDVVRHMRNLKALKVVKSCKSLEATAPKQPFLRPSASESFALRKPPDWDNDNGPLRQGERCDSPTPASRRSGHLEGRLSDRSSPKSTDTLAVRKQRSRPRPMSSQMLSGARSMSILSPTKEEDPAESPPEGGHQSGQEHTSGSPPSSISATPRNQSSILAPVQQSVVSAKCTSVTVPVPLHETSPWSENRRVVTTRTYDGQENQLSKLVTADGSEALQEHDLNECPPNPKVESESCPSAVSPEHSSSQTQLMERGAPEFLAQLQPFPAITISRATPSSEPKSEPYVLRRISVSEPGLRPENPHRCPPRSSRSTYGDLAPKNELHAWSDLKDPLARVSVAEDVASLAALAHFLEEEAAKVTSAPGTPGKPTDAKRHERPALHGQNGTVMYSRVTAKEENRERFSGERYSTFRQHTVEGENDMLPSGHESKKISAKLPGSKNVGKPKAIEGPDYSHLSGRTPSPKKSSHGPSDISQAPTNVIHKSSLVSPRAAIEIQTDEMTDLIVNESPRVSVRALAAKFNTGDSRSLSAPTTKSPSKNTSVNVRAVSDSSPKEKIIAPYTTNTPSPTKSQKSGKSDVSLHSVRLAPPVERNFVKTSPPRRFLRSDLNDLTPLRSVRKTVEETAASANGMLTLHASELPACCSPPGSQQRISLYDGTSVEYSGSASSDPMHDALSPHIKIGPRGAAILSEDMVITPCLNESMSLPMTINPLASPPPTRSNSLLHAQVRNLQQQVKSKTEEIRHLKQQLGRRGSLDIGALSEELRESKKEMNVWKCRAEVAEKQLEVMASLCTRVSRHNTENSASTLAGYPTAFSTRTRNSEDGVGRIRRALHGMDGAGSHTDVSEESTDTVVRDTREEPSTGD